MYLAFGYTKITGETLLGKAQGAIAGQSAAEGIEDFGIAEKGKDVFGGKAAEFGFRGQGKWGEPQIALAGGDDGMDLVRKIVAGAAQRLTEDGFLMVEIGNERAFAEAAFPELNLTWLSTSAGDDMVFLVEASQLTDFTA